MVMIKLVPMASELDTASTSPMYLSSTMPRGAGVEGVDYRWMSRTTKRATKERKAVPRRRTGEENEGQRAGCVAQS